MIRRMTQNDLKEVITLALNLYQESNEKALEEEISEKIDSTASSIFCYFFENKIIGFAEASIRYDYVEGTSSRPVGYLEGIYISPNYRLNGYAKMLVSECENWAKINKCIEFASDCALNNECSIKFHQHLGFVETNRIVCFKKNL